MMNAHTFHIPVMGLAYTVDSPLRVAHLGIDSVISLVDDILMEKLRKFYCTKYKLPFTEISTGTHDHRAKRITAYLNLINELVDKKFEALKLSGLEMSRELKEYFSILPDGSTLKEEFKKRTSGRFNVQELKTWLRNNLTVGKVDVNIMTKLDKENYKNGELLPAEFNDAHAALRGFAQSNLKSSLVLSAGMNPRLYSYMENFDDFYPDAEGSITKKITLKVSDYKSAFIQGRFLAKKGLWVSEYRIESGLNCGGHAFATDGILMGPILEEFKLNREELRTAVFTILADALLQKGRPVPAQAPSMRVTAQGGVGTAEEHNFLMDHYQLDSIGWGTPFLLVPEAVSIDNHTLELLIAAKEEDLELSNVSPLGVKFNNLKTSSMGVKKLAEAQHENPGSSCTKRFLVSTKEYSEKAMCTASKQYIKIKLGELDALNLSPVEYQNEYSKLTEKECLCKGLTTSAFLANGIDPETDGNSVSICPGPNLAYFSKKMSLREMVDHIYGRANMMDRTDRQHMFVNELKIYIEYLRQKMDDTKAQVNLKRDKFLTGFIANLNEGIDYYNRLFSNIKGYFDDSQHAILDELNRKKLLLNGWLRQIEG
jgi:hypothetical protein